MFLDSLYWCYKFQFHAAKSQLVEAQALDSEEHLEVGEINNPILDLNACDHKPATQHQPDYHPHNWWGITLIKIPQGYYGLKKLLDINLKELKAVMLTLQHFRNQREEKQVLIASYTTNVVAYINMQGRTHLVELCALPSNVPVPY